MDFILVVATVLLVSAAVWLWRLGKAQVIDLSLETLPIPMKAFAGGAIPRLYAITVRYRTTLVWLLIVTILAAIGSVISLEIFHLGLPLTILVFFLLLLLLFLLFSASHGAPEIMPLPETWSGEYAYDGEATLPRKVYEGDSQTISINLKPTFWIPQTSGESLRIQDTKSGKSVAVQIPQNGSLQQFLEIELLAAGLTVAGEKKQQQRLAFQTLSYHWNCYFQNSGNHTVSLVLRLVSVSATIEIGAIQHSIKVVKLDHLTQRQVWLVASLAGIVSGGFAIAEVLHQLGVW